MACRLFRYLDQCWLTVSWTPWKTFIEILNKTQKFTFIYRQAITWVDGSEWSLVQVIDCRLFGAKPESVTGLSLAQMIFLRWAFTLTNADLLSNGSSGTAFHGIWIKIQIFIQKWLLANIGRSQIPECICAISHHATFCNRNVHRCAHFCYKMMHCGIFVWCIVGFVRWVY